MLKELAVIRTHMALEVIGYGKHLKVCGLEKAQHPVGVRHGHESEEGRGTCVYTLCVLGVSIQPPRPTSKRPEKLPGICIPLQLYLFPRSVCLW